MIDNMFENNIIQNCFTQDTDESENMIDDDVLLLELLFVADILRIMNCANERLLITSLKIKKGKRMKDDIL